jgi:hypothetical protein
VIKNKINSFFKRVKGIVFLFLRAVPKQAIFSIVIIFLTRPLLPLPWWRRWPGWRRVYMINVVDTTNKIPHPSSPLAPLALVAEVARLAASLPQSGSVMAQHPTCSKDASFGRYFAWASADHIIVLLFPCDGYCDYRV